MATQKGQLCQNVRLLPAVLLFTVNDRNLYMLVVCSVHHEELVATLAAKSSVKHQSSIMFNVIVESNA